LIAFGQGKLTGDAAETVARHLETCDVCRNSVANAPADSFVGLVQSAKREGPAGTRLPAPSRLGASPSLMGGAAATAPPQGVPPELAEHPRFRIVRELGRGGMGVVYLAEHRLMERTVAIKVINRSVLDHPEALARFHGEVKAAARLQHANIVAAYDAEQAGDLHMLVMEFVTGIDLAKVVEKKGPLPVLHACHYVRQAALGLQHAFERGMVHRDIKPQNLMLTPRGQVKILDFGLARMARKPQQGRGLTQADQFMGTPEYVAPEQATDARSADVRADIYSLGCTLYCLLTGRPPFVEETVVKMVLAHIEKEAAPLHEVRPEVSPELSAVVARMLAKSPAERFQTPAEVVQALTPFCKPAAKEVAPPASPKRETRLGSDTPLGKPSPMNRSTLGKPKREGRRSSSGNKRHWAVLVAAGMALPLLLAGIIIVIKWTRKDGSSTETRVAIGTDNASPLGKINNPEASDKGFVPLFNGKDLTGWVCR
jgi:serine/threonine protein kinase